MLAENELLKAADPATSATESPGLTPAERAADKINEGLLLLHRERVAAMGVDGSGLFQHYNQRLDFKDIAGRQVKDLAHLIVSVLPKFDRYDVLRAGLGELAFVLAALGLRTGAFDQNARRLEAIYAGLAKFGGEDPEWGRRLMVGRAAVPDVARQGRYLAIAHYFVGFTPAHEDKILDQLACYSAVLIDPGTFLYARPSPEERDAAIQAMRSRGFTRIQEYPRLGVVYCGRPDDMGAELPRPALHAPGSTGQQIATGGLSASGEATSAAVGPVVDVDMNVQTWTLAVPYRHAEGRAWLGSLPRELHSRTDNGDAPYQSYLRLFEDGRELGPGHAVHEFIRNEGSGQYSFWIDSVYFSTSDGSDPNTNGRSYTVTEKVPSATLSLAEQELAAEAEVRFWTLAVPFSRGTGQTWLCSLPPELLAKSDTHDAPYQSHLRLFEDGLELGPGHARHATISNVGGGHYSFWRGSLYFSSSDGSDPNSSGRSYTVALVK